MDQLQQLIVNNEDWLMHRILRYAKEHGYVKYTSTLAEAWRISIDNLSETILTAVENYPDGLELSPDEDYTRDPIALFGILEAKKHRSRGLTLDYTTRFVGTPCCPAGIDAQNYDMGNMWCNDPEDMVNSKYIIIWGANPAYCSIHSMKGAAARGQSGGHRPGFHPDRGQSRRVLGNQNQRRRRAGAGHGSLLAGQRPG